MTWRRLAFDILRVVRGERLACGCLAGVYETYTGRTVTIIDIVGPSCRASDHRDGARIGEEARGVGPTRRSVVAAAIAAVWLAAGLDGAQPPRQGGRDQAGRPGNTRTFSTTVPAHDADVILARPTDTSIALSVVAYRRVRTAVWYGIDVASMAQASAPVILDAGVPSLLPLDGLQPDTRGTGGAGRSAERSTTGSRARWRRARRAADADGHPAFAARRPGWPLPIHDLLVKNRVSAVFKGHDHFYARQQRDQVAYITVPQPADARGGTVRSAADYGYSSGTLLDGSGYLRVRVSAETVPIEFVDVRAGTGRVADRVAVR
jgi:hypothetical protein